MRESRTTCITCATEALLRAHTFLNEAIGRDGKEAQDRVLDAVEQALHAEHHLAEQFPELRKRIRQWRKKWETCHLVTDRAGECINSSNLEELDELIEELRSKFPNLTLEELKTHGIEDEEPQRMFSKEAKRVFKIVKKITEIEGVSIPKIRVLPNCKMPNGQDCNGAYDTVNKVIYIRAPEGMNKRVIAEEAFHHVACTKNGPCLGSEGENYAKTMAHLYDTYGTHYIEHLNSSGIRVFNSEKSLRIPYADIGKMTAAQVGAKIGEKLVRMGTARLVPTMETGQLQNRLSTYLNALVGFVIAAYAGMKMSGDKQMYYMAGGTHFIAELTDAVESQLRGGVVSIGARGPQPRSFQRGVTQLGEQVGATIVTNAPAAQPTQSRGKVTFYTGVR